MEQLLGLHDLYGGELEHQGQDQDRDRDRLPGQVGEGFRVQG